VIDRSVTVEARRKLADVLVATPAIFNWPATDHKRAVDIAVAVREKLQEKET